MPAQPVPAMKESFEDSAVQLYIQSCQLGKWKKASSEKRLPAHVAAKEMSAKERVPIEAAYISPSLELDMEIEGHDSRLLQLRTVRRHSLREDFRHEFDFSRTTSSNHSNHEAEFFGPYAHIRERLDFAYHGNFTRTRQALQDRLVAESLESAPSSEAQSPWIIFTCGAMGAGKSFVVQWMRENRRLPFLSAVTVDADFFRERLPEWCGYVARDPTTAGDLTQAESGYCVELAQEAALESNKNIIVDGSLKDHAWYSHVMRDIRERHPHYCVALLCVQASERACLLRAQQRAARTGRHVPVDRIRHSHAATAAAVDSLRHYADMLLVVDNEDGRTPSIASLATSLPTLPVHRVRSPSSWASWHGGQFKLKVAAAASWFDLPSSVLPPAEPAGQLQTIVRPASAVMR